MYQMERKRKRGKWGELSYLINSVGRIKREKKEKRNGEEEGAVREKNEIGVRSSTFSLRSTKIGPSVFV